MASFFKRPGSQYYYLKVKRGGNWAQVPTDIRIGSQNALRRIRQRTAEEEVKELQAPKKSHGWRWVPGWLNATYRDKTLLRYAAAWTALEVYLSIHKVTGPDMVNYSLCTAYPTWRTQVDPEIMKPCHWNTAITEIKVLSAIMQEAVRSGMVQANPCFRLGLRRRDVKKKPEFTEEHQRIVEEALAAPDAKKWMRDSWIIAMSQGFRLAATAVPVRDIDLILNVVSVTSKGKTHTAPLHPAVRELAIVAKREKRTVLVDLPPSPAKEWWKFFRRIGLEGFSFHSTRVTVTTRLARGGFSKQQTMAYVGHASETVHDVYTRLSAPDVGHLGDVLRTSFSSETRPGSKSA